MYAVDHSGFIVPRIIGHAPGCFDSMSLRHSTRPDCPHVSSESQKGFSMAADFQLVDAHAHLNEVKHIESVLAAAEAAGVKRIVAVGMDLESNQKTRQLAYAFPAIVFPAIGYHPWSIIKAEIDDTLASIDRHLAKCAALGEVGLDYKAKVKKALQIEVFGSVLNLAKKHQKPVNIHALYSYERSYNMVRESGVEKAVFHWYSGPPDILDNIIDNGFFISATPSFGL